MNMKKILAVPIILLCLMIIQPALAAPATAAAMRQTTESIQPTAKMYHFYVHPYSDMLHVYFEPDGLVHGYVDLPTPSPCYPAPVLGMWTGGGMVYWTDWKTDPGCWEMSMKIIMWRDMSGYGWKTNDGIEVFGPEEYWLEPFTPVMASQGARVDAAIQLAERVEPDLVGFYLRPYIDEEYLGGFPLTPLPIVGINGYADVPGHTCYPAPHLGILAGGMLIFADDYVTDPSCYELRLNILDTKSLAGISYATVDGLIVDGPMDVWLEWM